VVRGAAPGVTSAGRGENGGKEWAPERGKGEGQAQNAVGVKGADEISVEGRKDAETGEVREAEDRDGRDGSIVRRLRHCRKSR